jgi:phosphoacetylglucosamine mutase
VNEHPHTNTRARGGGCTQNTLKVPVVIAKTGVKHLHHAAVQNFDIGIYFEANGHGTVVFSRLYEEFAVRCRDEWDEPFFVQVARLINPAVGDAISDLLLVDYLLRHGGMTMEGGATEGGDGDGDRRCVWTLQDWNTRLYADLPSRMLKVKVKDRSLVVCNDNEAECIRPVELQPLLREAMDGYPAGRTFVRPSGTEDVVRIYAEAATRGGADALAVRASQIVYDTCFGVGERPHAM